MPLPQLKEPPFLENQELYQYLLELHQDVYGIGSDITGRLDRDNLADEVMTSDENLSITGAWTFSTPFTITSTTVISNLNADLWDGFHSNTYTGATTLTTLGTITTGIWQGTVIDQAYLDVNLLLQDGSRPLTANWDVGTFKITAAQLESDIAIGTAPFIVTSTTVVPNLNADLWDGYQFADYFNQTLLTTSSPQFANLILTAGGDIRPSADSTTALNIAQADGTNFVTFDTTNKRIGMNNTPTANVELRFGSPVRAAATTDGIFVNVRATGALRSGICVAEKANTSSDANVTYGINSFAYHYGSANLTAASFGLVGGRYGISKQTSGGIVTDVRGVSSVVQFGTDITGTYTKAVDLYAEAIAAVGGTIDKAYGIFSEAHTKTTGTLTKAYGAWFVKQSNATTTNSGIVLAGDEVGADMVFGGGQDSKIYYQDTPIQGLVLSPRVVGTGAVVIGVGAAGVDYRLAFDGETNDGLIDWMEDEDYFQFNDDIFLNDGEDLKTGTTTGSKLGGSDTAKVSVYSATPIVRQNHIVDADGTLADATTKINAMLVALENFGIVKTA